MRSSCRILKLEQCISQMFVIVAWKDGQIVKCLLKKATAAARNRIWHVFYKELKGLFETTKY